MIAGCPLWAFIIITLLIGIQGKRLRDVGASIRNLECIDTMATIDCVVAEKSGTITNEKFLV